MPHCAVPSCTEKKGGHQFPKDPSVLQKWLDAIRRENYTPSENMIVCRSHFTNEDYVKPIFSVLDEPRLKLKPDAVPSKFPWNDPNKRIIKGCSTTQDIRKKKQIQKYENKTKQNKNKKGFIQNVALESLLAIEPKTESTELIPSQTHIVITNPNSNIQGNVIRKLIPIKSSDIKSKALNLIPIKSSDIKILNHTLTNESQNTVDVSTIKNENTYEYFISPKNVLVGNKACQANFNSKLKSIDTTFICNRIINGDRCEASIQIDIAPKLIPLKVSDIENKSIENKQYAVSKINETTLNAEFISVSTIKTEPGLINDQFFDVPLVESENIKIKEELGIESGELRIKTEQLSDDEITDYEFNEHRLIKEEPMDEMNDT